MKFGKVAAGAAAEAVELMLRQSSAALNRSLQVAINQQSLIVLVITATILMSLPLAECKSTAPDGRYLSASLIAADLPRQRSQQQQQQQLQFQSRDDLFRLMSSHWTPVNRAQLQPSSTLSLASPSNYNSAFEQVSAAHNRHEHVAQVKPSAANHTTLRPCDLKLKALMDQQPEMAASSGVAQKKLDIFQLVNSTKTTPLPVDLNGQDNDDDDSADDQAEEQEEELTGSNQVLLDDMLASNESVSHGRTIPAPLSLNEDLDEPLVARRPPPTRHLNDERTTSGSQARQQQQQQQYDDEGGPGGDSEADSEGTGRDQETPPDEAAERREQEAAEASEAEAADRSALAEQQQAQREIILAQAQSEAKAIREQQEALLKQQQLQQQILMRRNQNFLDDDNRLAKGEKRARPKQMTNQNQANYHTTSGSHNNARQQGVKRQQQQQQQQQQSRPSSQVVDQGDNSDDLAAAFDSTGHQFTPIDNQFSDQLDNSMHANERGTTSASMQHLQQQLEHSKSARQHLRQQQQRATPQDIRLQQQQQRDANTQHEQLVEDEMSGDYSMRQPLFINNGSGSGNINSDIINSSYTVVTTTSSPVATLIISTEEQPTTLQEPLTIGARFNLTSDDLMAAAQHHHYGAHYGSLSGHHKGGGGGGGGGYYQFAESHKKGQFDSGFKRGSKKFTISGHSSQHKGHAEGHVKWHGKKGKGTHYWDYKHKNKKHYGGGDSYGGGHHHY